MKKTAVSAFLLFLILATYSSCKHKECDDKKKNLIQEKEALKKILSPGMCGNTIIMNKSLTDKIANWESDNRKYLVDHPGTWTDTDKPDPNPETCAHKKLYVSISRFGGVQEFADWLQVNGPLICYEETNPVIECEHRITNETMRQIIVRTTPKATWTIGRLREELAKKGIDLAKTNYESYIHFHFYLADFSLDAYNEFDGKRSCISVPMLRSIIKTFSLRDTDELEFSRVYEDDVRKTIITVKGKNYFYNFSQIPPFTDSDLTGCSPL